MLVNRIFIVFFPISFLLRFYSVLILADSLLCLTVTKMDIHINVVILTFASLSLVSVPLPLFRCDKELAVSVGWSVCWSVGRVTQSFDNPHVTPYWPTWPCCSDLCFLGFGFCMEFSWDFDSPRTSMTSVIFSSFFDESSFWVFI